MELTPGMAFRCMEPPRHIYIPLFDSEKADDGMLLVNFTTLRENCVDDSCILGPNDYPDLSHATTVAYSRAMVGGKRAFVRAVNAGHFIRLDDIPAATLRRIIAGAHQSDELSAVKKRVLPPH